MRCPRTLSASQWHSERLYRPQARGSDGRRASARKGGGEESPGSTDRRCRVMPGGGDPRESATESRPPRAFARRARVKGCGKSAPRFQQWRRHGKPHREQNRIGAAHGPDPARRPGWLLEAAGNSRPRGMAVQAGRPAGQNPAYRSSGLILPTPAPLRPARRAACCPRPDRCARGRRRACRDRPRARGCRRPGRGPRRHGSPRRR